jgi:cytochrome c oxidase subunit IV
VVDDNIPDHAIIAMLRREVLLTKAKLHFLVFEHLQQERTLRTYKSQLKQVCVYVCVHVFAWWAFVFEHLQQERTLRTYKSQLKQVCVCVYVCVHVYVCGRRVCLSTCSRSARCAPANCSSSSCGVFFYTCVCVSLF